MMGVYQVVWVYNFIDFELKVHSIHSMTLAYFKNRRWYDVIHACGA